MHVYVDTEFVLYYVLTTVCIGYVLVVYCVYMHTFVHAIKTVRGFRTQTHMDVMQ